jgi:hypothetical protein
MASIVSKIVVGETDIPGSFGRVFDKFLRELDTRHALIEKVLYREETKKTDVVDRYVHSLGVRAYQDFQEILVLMENGLPTGASKILRSLYERVVTCTYLSKNPDAVADFAEYDAVHKQKLLQRLPKEAREKMLPPEVAQLIEQKFEAVKARFTREVCDECGKQGLMGSWTKLDTYSLAKKAGEGLDEIYGQAFLLPTLHLHTTATGILGNIEATPEGFILKTEELKDRGEILLFAHFLLCKIVQLHNRYFELGLDAEVDDAIGAFNVTWAKDIHPV